MQRWELALSIAALLILTVGALVTPMTTLLGSDAWMTLLAFTLIVPMVAGLVLGVGIVGREIAMRTAHLAWTLEPRRQPAQPPRTASGPMTEAPPSPG